jgi:hypothetical protein
MSNRMRYNVGIMQFTNPFLLFYPWVLAASIKPHTTNTKQLNPGTRNNIFQYGVVRSEDIIAIVTSSATLVAAINMLRLTVSQESAKSNTLIAMISKPSCRQI